MSLASLAVPPLRLERKGLGNVAYTTCTRCNYSCSPIRLQYLSSSLWDPPRLPSFTEYKNCIMEESEILTAIKVAVEAAGYRSLEEKQTEVIVNFIKSRETTFLPCYRPLWQKFMLYLSTESVWLPFKDSRLECDRSYYTPLIAIIKEQVT